MRRVRGVAAQGIEYVDYPAPWRYSFRVHAGRFWRNRRGKSRDSFPPKKTIRISRSDCTCAARPLLQALEVSMQTTHAANCIPSFHSFLKTCICAGLGFMLSHSGLNCNANPGVLCTTPIQHVSQASAKKDTG